MRDFLLWVTESLLAGTNGLRVVAVAVAAHAICIVTYDVRNLLGRVFCLGCALKPRTGSVPVFFMKIR